MLGFSLDKNGSSVLVLELMRRGSLDTLLYKKSITFPLSMQLKINFSIASGLQYLHGLEPKIIHQYLKSNK